MLDIYERLEAYKYNDVRTLDFLLNRAPKTLYDKFVADTKLGIVMLVKLAKILEEIKSGGAKTGGIGGTGAQIAQIATPTPRSMGSVREYTGYTGESQSQMMNSVAGDEGSIQSDWMEGVEAGASHRNGGASLMGEEESGEFQQPPLPKVNILEKAKDLFNKIKGEEIEPNSTSVMGGSAQKYRNTHTTLEESGMEDEEEGTDAYNQGGAFSSLHLDSSTKSHTGTGQSKKGMTPKQMKEEYNSEQMDLDEFTDDLYGKIKKNGENMGENMGETGDSSAGLKQVKMDNESQFDEGSRVPGGQTEDTSGDYSSYDSRRTTFGGRKNSIPLEKKWAVVNIRKYLKNFGFTYIDIAKILGISARDVENIWRKYINTGFVERKRGAGRKRVYNEEIAEAIRKFVDQANRRGAMPLMRDIWEHLEEIGMPIKHNKRILSRYLHSLGYTYKKVRPTSIDRFKPNVQENLRKFLETFMENRKLPKEERLEEIYIDETFVNEVHARSICWTKKKGPCGIVRPAASYQRVCIVGAVSRDGWTACDYNDMTDALIESENGNRFSYKTIMYFKVRNQEYEDYHKHFNKEIFIDYFENNCLNNLPTPSVMIMDRVSYHTVPPEGQFNARHATKNETVEWLMNMGVQFDAVAKVGDLRKLALKLDVQTDSHIQVMARERGHRVLFLPQYIIYIYIYML